MILSDKETIISIDVETTGPVPGLYSMIDIGACVVTNTDLRFEASLLEDPNAGWHRRARDFWYGTEHRRRVLTQIQDRARDSYEVMSEFAEWIESFGCPILMSFPAGFDYSFIHFYWWKYLDREPKFSHYCLDGNTIAMSVLKCSYSDTRRSSLKKSFPEGFTKQFRHSHLGIDDAIQQAYLFRELVKFL